MDFYTQRQLSVRLPIILETPTEMIIEGVAHDKTTLNPTFLRKLDYYEYVGHNYGGVNYIPFIMNRFWIRNDNSWQNASWTTYHRPDADLSNVKNDGGSGIAKQVWQSQYDPNVFFVYGPFCGGELLKVDARTNTPLLPQIQVSYMWGGANLGIYEKCHCIYHEDANYLYGQCQSQLYPASTWSAEGTYAAVGVPWLRINKSSLTDTSAPNSYGMGVVGQIIAKVGNILFMSINGHWATSTINSVKGRHRLIAVNLTTGVGTDLLSFDGAGYVHCPEPSFARQKTGAASSLKDYYIVQSNGATGWFHSRVDLYVEGISAVKNTCTLDFSSGAFAAVDMKCTSSENRQVATRCFTVVGATKEYMGWIYYEKSSNSTEPIDRFNMYLFQIDNATSRNNLIARQLFAFGARIRGVLNMNTNWTQFMVITETFISFMVLNESLNRFDEVTRMAGSFKAVGIDDLDRIWIMTTDGRVSYTSAYVPTRVSIVLENATYNYVGTVINSFVNVSAYDALSARIAVSVNLVIDAPASTVTFADGTKTKTITTSASAETQVPIVINSNTSFRVLANTGV